MSTVKEIESAITRLSLQEQQAMREWLEDVIEDQLELTDEVKGKLDQARQDIARAVFARSNPSKPRGCRAPNLVGHLLPRVRPALAARARGGTNEDR